MSRRERVSILYNQFELEVVGTFYPEETGDWETPGISCQFEPISIYLEGCNIDIIDLLDEHMESIADIVLDKLQDGE
jgi:hypothetical protein